MTTNTEVPDCSQARVLIVGDVMLDRYWHGPSSRISPEAPVPVVNVEATEERPGGAANVALNVAALGAQATLIGLVGDDAAAETLATQLRDQGITPHLQSVRGHATICKLRILSQHQQLMRLDFETPFGAGDRDGLGDRFERALAATDIVVVSDYAKGTLGDPQALIARARTAGVPVIVDPKGRDFSRYRGAYLITPNGREFETEAGAFNGFDGLTAAARELATQTGIDNLLVTQGEGGMTLVPAVGEALHLPAHSHDVFDVTGAGDTVVATLATLLAAGAPLATATAIANHAAGIAVTRVGATTVTLPELREAVGGGDAGRGVTEAEALTERLRAARARGERIVMTNGCFDILHAGHVAYLEQARALGDRLVVAINDDTSVARLKGSDRPLNPLEQRMSVLAGLAAVDWVVAFTDDTPADLIEQLAPDILVKGGDYTPDAVAGADAVKARGGDVVILDYVDGQSSSDLIARIRHPG
jgi:D-beta-D-heptose 7-phosphate kinase/D-beta-D-heptose 1-phosphate adenosyltransferase